MAVPSEFLDDGFHVLGTIDNANEDWLLGSRGQDAHQRIGQQLVPVVEDELRQRRECFAGGMFFQRREILCRQERPEYPAAPEDSYPKCEHGHQSQHSEALYPWDSPPATPRLLAAEIRTQQLGAGASQFAKVNVLNAEPEPAGTKA